MNKERKTILLTRLVQGILLLSGMTLAVSALAAQNAGAIAANALTPLAYLISFLYRVCYVVAIGFFAGAVVQFKAHRDNPSLVRINQPIFLIIFGIMIGGLPILAQISGADKVVQHYLVYATYPNFLGPLSPCDLA